MRMLGFLGGVLSLAMAFSLGSHIDHMFDSISIVFALVCPLCFTLMGHGNDLWRALGAVFFKSKGKLHRTP